MKKILCALCVFCFILSSCNSHQYLSIDQLKLGMPIYEVEKSYHRTPEQTAAESGKICDYVQYRYWLDNKKRHWLFGVVRGSFTPYFLTFELFPPVTEAQCKLLAEKHNVTDPNELSDLMSIQGLRPSRLIQVKIDEATLTRLAIHDASVRQALATQSAAFQMQQATQNAAIMSGSSTFHAIPDGAGGYILH